jgi:tRNA threonylcarbamoyladenosine biosynthesis protein TsaE
MPHGRVASEGINQEPKALHEGSSEESGKPVRSNDRPSGVAAREVITHSPEETLAFGRELAMDLTPPCLVLLVGELGSGKTTLTKGIVAGLGAAREEEVTSPSFTLVHEYGGACKVYHADLYRIEGTQELATVGWDELWVQDAIVIVEWGEKLWDNAPAPRVLIQLEHISSEERRITVARVGR